MLDGLVYIGRNYGSRGVCAAGFPHYLTFGIVRTREAFGARDWQPVTWKGKAGKPSGCDVCAAADASALLLRHGIACAVAVVSVRDAFRASNDGVRPVDVSFAVVAAGCLELLAGEHGEHVVPGAVELRTAVEKHYHRELPLLPAAPAWPPGSNQDVPDPA